ncbi:hypothetical protein E3Q06_04139 [Wallemia mellicola]|nr:hypothetical protein E3Q21_04141 [Wallemia mellicola]TIB83483.1 hypothetical protein E3Q20_04122 [Wallemia mellicola]TIC31106.1 hypothetical protein E3Q09_04134 [Wallemia mellicola]TIC37758.1 hypothetical protein E3Q07_04151 [Wallemia mellicola]TIC44845.1 hypothetical protein E3Q06_04139 [Wallemia mellicola]
MRHCVRKVEEIIEKMKILEKRIEELEKCNNKSKRSKQENKQAQESSGHQSLVSLCQVFSISILGLIVMGHLILFFTFSSGIFERIFERYLSFLLESTFRFYEFIGIS